MSPPPRPDRPGPRIGIDRRTLAAAFAAGGVVASGALRAAPVAVEERAALLARHFEILRPDGPGPFPVVFQFHGCGGRQGLQVPYAQAAVEAGWMAVIVDSFAPRGITRAAALSTVCSGLRLRGRERAGDLYASLHWARRNRMVDASRMAAAGWSHGGWTVMDALSAGQDRARSSGLSGLDPDPLAGLDKVFLVYPWAGVGSMTVSNGWDRPVDVVMLVAGRDSVSGQRLPMLAAERARESGARVRTVLFPTATHAFDDDAANDPRFRFEPELARAAMRLYTRTLGEAAQK